MNVKCELCPLQDHCQVLGQAEADNDNSYHPQVVVRVFDFNCPLLQIIEAYRNAGGNNDENKDD